MPLILPGNVGSATAATTYSIANSCRFEDGDSARMTLTHGSTSDAVRKTFTFSCWFKLGNLGSEAGERTIYGADDGSVYFYVAIDSSDRIRVGAYSSGSHNYDILSTAKVRDPAAWYSLVVACDSTDSTAANRVKIYLNGTQLTAFDTNNIPAEDYVFEANSTVAAYIGGSAGSTYFDGYLAEVMMVTASQLAPTIFGEFDSDSPTIWKPIDITGQAVGTNGFYLDFEASDNLGNDASGGTDWTESNLAAIDQCTDTPTNNFCTLNPLDNYHFQSTYSQGNCKIVTGGSGRETFTTGTMGVSSGKWYYEVKCVTASSQDQMGFTDTPSNAYNDVMQNTTNGRKGFVYRGSAGAFRVDGGTQITANYDTWTDGDVLGVYIDLDNLEAYVSKNGTLQNSGTGQTITAASSTKGFYLPAIGDEESDSFTAEVNFGNPVSALSSAVADANGYGQFEYSPSGTFDGASKDFLAICSKNLAEYGG